MATCFTALISVTSPPSIRACDFARMRPDVDDDLSLDLVLRALAREPQACRRLVAELSPAIHGRVTAAL
jgi:hypothetical protein